MSEDPEDDKANARYEREARAGARQEDRQTRAPRAAPSPRSSGGGGGSSASMGSEKTSITGAFVVIAVLILARNISSFSGLLTWLKAPVGGATTPTTGPAPTDIPIITQPPGSIFPQQTPPPLPNIIQPPGSIFGAAG